MRQPIVLFPYVEAGMGHITPMDAIADAFEQKYGNQVQVVRSKFFTEGQDVKLKNFEDGLTGQVRKHNQNPRYGFFITTMMNVFAPFSLWATMNFFRIGSKKRGIRHMEELGADLVVSTHWASNYYALKAKHKPLTVQYIPDAHINPMFAYPSNLTMISMPSGYASALKKKFRFNENNLKLVPFCIRKEAFEVTKDKKENRKALGLDAEKLTIVLAEGGYGIGKTQVICEEIVKRDLPVTIVPICGKNKEAYTYLTSLKTGKNTQLKVEGFTNRIFEYMASADLFMGKSGASTIAEPTFFGVPTIVTTHATNIEKKISKYYVEEVGCAIECFEPKQAVDKVEEFLNNPESLRILQKNTEKVKDNYGAEKTADCIFELLTTRFPHLKEDAQK